MHLYYSADWQVLEDEKLTSYDAASGGNVVNQVQRAYNGLGQLITEWQVYGGIKQ